MKTNRTMLTSLILGSALFLGQNLAAQTKSTSVCPVLKGLYTCTGNTKNFVGDIEIGQNGQDYQLPVVPGAGNNPVYNRTADGQTKTFHDEPHWGAVTVEVETECQGARTLVDQIRMPSPLGPVSMESTYTLDTSGKKLKITQILTQGNHSSVTKSNCNRK